MRGRQSDHASGDTSHDGGRPCPGARYRPARCAAADEAAAPRRARQQTTVARPRRKTPAPPPSVTIIGASDAHGMLGRDVRSPADEDMGRIVDVIVDRAGAVRAAVIDFGGFLGVGSRKIVVDWNALHFGQVANKRRQHHARTDQGAGQGGAGIQGGSRRSWCSAPSGSLQPLQFDPLSGRRSQLIARPHPSETDCRCRRRARRRPMKCATASRAAERPSRRAAAASRAEPARPRLVHLLSRRRADRLRSVHRGLSDDAEMDPGRDRPRAVDRRHRRADRADAGRRHRRCRPLGAAGRGPCGRRPSASARSPMRHGRSFPWWWPRRRCMPPPAACSVRRSRRSASVWSGRSRSANGSGATRASPRSATASPRP